MIYIGIDPGLTGAVAIMYTETGTVQFFDTPVLTVKSGKKTKHIMDAHAAAECLRGVRTRNALETVYVFVEKVNAMPGKAVGGDLRSMGATSAFNFGMGFGIWQGVLAALAMRYELVHPATWKKLIMRDMDKEKEASRVKALQLFPAVAEALTLKKHHGRADALLLAEYGRRMEQRVE